jgi:glutathione S-transferase
MEMKLYYRPGACSQASHIVLHETGLEFDSEKVDTVEGTTESGGDFLNINLKGQVPVLELDDGQFLTEGAVIVQYIADKEPESGLLPAAGTLERARVQEWLSFVGSELHKPFDALFNPAVPEEYKTIAKENLARKFAFLDARLKDNEYLAGDSFTVADPYPFVVLSWTQYQDINLGEYKNISAYIERVAARPCVQETLKAEGLI